ncbi:MAG TPA: hypothetical protein VHB23_07235 [Devosiaceae bacterium]|jgi:hypothetical protein|nr:hypothetical protein [Devosiaceae bacterium]
MALKTLALGLAASLAFAAPALAYERHGTITFDSRFGSGTSTFSEAYDPEAGTFSRTGKIALDRNRTITYSLAGTCRQPPTTCSFSGSAVGPFGGKWRVEGTLERDHGKRHLVGSLTGPDGKSITFDRELAGRESLMRTLLQSGGADK